MWKHKKESKWMVRGGRKVRCYLCGKKILAKRDSFLFHAETGYYSHQSCFSESKTMGGNERRRAVKKIAVGAAIATAIAAGAGKFISISSQSKGLNSPESDAQTILTSQGLILPSLTSDPANPVPGQMWYRSDAGVMAHFDGVQNRVVYSSEINDGNVNVTSKGIVNGLSVLPNDGKGGFGPDTTLGATAPGQYGGIYTQSTGLLEAWNVAVARASSPGRPAKIVLSSGDFIITAGITLSGTSIYSLHIEGAGQEQTRILANVTSGYAITLNAATFNQAELIFENLTFSTSAGTPSGALNADFTSANSAQNGMVFRNVFIDNASWGTQPINAIQLNSVQGFNYVEHPSLAKSIFVMDATQVVFFGGKLNHSCFFGVNSVIVIGGVLIDQSAANPIYVNDCDSVVVMGAKQIVAANPLNGGAGNQSTGAITFIGCYQNGEFMSNELANGDTWTIDKLQVIACTSTITTNSVFMANPNSASTVIYDVEIGDEIYYSGAGRYTNIPLNSPTISANPPVSGTAYQNTNPYDIRLKIPVTYNPTTTAAATLATGISSTSTVTTSTKVSIPAGLTAADGEILTYEMVVPAGWYFELVATNATIGTAEVQAA